MCRAHAALIWRLQRESCSGVQAWTAQSGRVQPARRHGCMMDLNYGRGRAGQFAMLLDEQPVSLGLATSGKIGSHVVARAAAVFRSHMTEQYCAILAAQMALIICRCVKAGATITLVAPCHQSVISSPE